MNQAFEVCSLFLSLFRQSPKWILIKADLEEENNLSWFEDYQLALGYKRKKPRTVKTGLSTFR